MGNVTEYTCNTCGAIYLLCGAQVARRPPLHGNPWKFTSFTARGIIYLANRLAPEKGVSEDIDDLIKAAYEYLGEECPVETLMITPDQAQTGLAEILTDD